VDRISLITGRNSDWDGRPQNIPIHPKSNANPEKHSINFQEIKKHHNIKKNKKTKRNKSICLKNTANSNNSKLDEIIWNYLE
jgi:hypothetical protein